MHVLPTANHRLSVGHYGTWPFRRRLRLTRDEYLTHLHCIGKSKSGKSNFLAYIVPRLILSGIGVTVIDPHGDLARLILSHLVAYDFFHYPSAFDNLLYLDIATADNSGMYLPFNVLKQPHMRADAIASNVREAFHRAWPELS